MPIASDRYQLNDVLDRFDGLPIVVVGDIMLDEYWWGRVERISPEAPVPVVSVERREFKLGGGANVARNIRALGGRPVAVGVIGPDSAARTIREQMREHALSDETLIVDTGRPTTQKTRIVAHHQQVVRADVEDTSDVSDDVTKRLIDVCRTAMQTARGVVISDYGKGVVTRALVESIVACARERDLFVAVDPKDAHCSVYRGVTTLTPNHHEAAFMAGRRIRDLESLRRAGFELLKTLSAESLLVTRGEHGMALFEPSGELTLIPTVARTVFDVTGAGDTVIAAVAMGLAAGGSMMQAACIANVAAGEVIKVLGTASTTTDAIREHLPHIDAARIERQNHHVSS
ncbi:MAG TPA: D-glycero-beta-D-manno-heptose-7-phosphate kinase [candidate division Zixibacteria bacterium]|jgi:D-beta-D-heptose 7-phosphate kinase/D-beta-D-heptose 1-phosphate adenosyltransferase